MSAVSSGSRNLLIAGSVVVMTVLLLWLLGQSSGSRRGPRCPRPGRSARHQRAGRPRRRAGHRRGGGGPAPDLAADQTRPTSCCCCRTCSTRTRRPSSRASSTGRHPGRHRPGLLVQAAPCGDVRPDLRAGTSERLCQGCEIDLAGRHRRRAVRGTAACCTGRPWGQTPASAAWTFRPGGHRGGRRHRGRLRRGGPAGQRGAGRRRERPGGGGPAGAPAGHPPDGAGAGPAGHAQRRALARRPDRPRRQGR